MLGKILLVAAAAVGGIYLTSPEGKNARVALLRRKAALEPIINDLLEQAKDVLAGAKQVNSDEVRANVQFLVNEVRGTLLNVDIDKTLAVIRDALRVASRRLEEAKLELKVNDKAKAKPVLSNTAIVKPKVRTASKPQKVANKVSARGSNGKTKR